MGGSGGAVVLGLILLCNVVLLYADKDSDLLSNDVEEAAIRQKRAPAASEHKDEPRDKKYVISYDPTLDYILNKRPLTKKAWHHEKRDPYYGEDEYADFEPEVRAANEKEAYEDMVKRRTFQFGKRKFMLGKRKFMFGKREAEMGDADMEGAEDWDVEKRDVEDEDDLPLGEDSEFQREERRKFQLGKRKFQFGKRKFQFGKRKFQFGKRKFQFGKRKFQFGKREGEIEEDGQEAGDQFEEKRKFQFGKRQSDSDNFESEKRKFQFGKRHSDSDKFESEKRKFQFGKRQSDSDKIESEKRKFQFGKRESDSDKFEEKRKFQFGKRESESDQFESEKRKFQFGKRESDKN